ncbi:MAG: histidine triad protein [Acidobacteria bacterium]|nr:histidine triad protein [Acidobacteriota bacterium]
MDYLWTPWRYQYVATADKDGGCIFCEAPAAGDDARVLIVYRGKKNYIILNRYPYTSGHVMIVPYVHQGELPALDAATVAEMMELAQTLERALELGDTSFITSVGETRVQPEELSVTYERLQRVLESQAGEHTR